MTGRLLAAWLREVVRRAPRSSRVGLVVLGLLFVVALLSPLGGYPVGADVAPAAAGFGPSWEHWLGTDHLGRDIFWRSVLATRAFVGPATGCVAISAALGVPLGWLAGRDERALALVARALITSVASLPMLVWVLLGCTFVRSDLAPLVWFAGIGTFPGLAEAVREHVERSRREEFVAAMKVHGLSGSRVVGLHLLLRAGRTIGRHLVGTFGAFVALEATLSYLGTFGVAEPWPSWGNMIAFDAGRAQPWAVTAPAFALWGSQLGTAAAARVFSEPADG